MAQTLGKLGGRPKRQAIDFKNSKPPSIVSTKTQNRQAQAKINTKTAKHGARGI